MSNLLPKKSWHVYNEKNREKVKRDETTAKIEKERVEERAKSADREYRLSILRSRAKIDNEYEQLLKEEESKKEIKRFELFSAKDEFKDQTKGEYEKEVQFNKNFHDDRMNKKCHNHHDNNSSKKNRKQTDIEADHFKNDPLFSKLANKKSNGKDYSFV